MSPLVWTLWFGLLWAQGCLYCTSLYKHCLDILLGLRITAEQLYLFRSKSIQWGAVSLTAVCAGKLSKTVTIPWLREQVTQPGMVPIVCPNSLPSQNSDLAYTASWEQLLVFSSNHAQAFLGDKRTGQGHAMEHPHKQNRWSCARAWVSPWSFLVR